MCKKALPRLRLTRETLQDLAGGELRKIAGGLTVRRCGTVDITNCATNCPHCHI